jgi:hypothetical protein
VNEKSTSDKFTDSTLVQFLNDGILALVSEVRNIFPWFGLLSTTISQTLGTETTTMPTDWDRIVHLRDNTSSLGDKAPAYLTQLTETLGSGFAFTDKDFWWVNSDQNNTWELLYTRLPWEVHYGTAAAFDTTSLTISTSANATGNVWSGGSYFDDIYNGAEIYAATSTTLSGQVGPVTDYAGSTGVFSLTWPDGVPTGTLTYEIMPIIDAREFGPLLAWEVALAMQHIGRHDPLVLSRRHPYKRQKNRFLSKWRSATTHAPAYPRFINLERS